MIIDIRSIPTTIDPKCCPVSDFIEVDYERCNPDDTWDDLVHRARFDRFSRGKMNEWLSIGKARQQAFQSRLLRELSKIADEMVLQTFYGMAA
jgi:hypothetical protein